MFTLLGAFNQSRFGSSVTLATSLVAGISLSACDGTSEIFVNEGATQLAIVEQPTTTQAGVVIWPAVRVVIQDADGLTVSHATDAVTLEIGTNPGGGVLSGTATVNAVAGIARFDDLSIDQAGDRYTLAAASGGLSGAESLAFDILDSSARIDTVILSSTTLTIGGPNVAYTATLTNGSAATLSPVGIQAYVDQGTVSRAAGGAEVGSFSDCGGGPEDLPRGTCTFSFSVIASNTGGGPGTLVAGDAEARIELRQYDCNDMGCFAVELDTFTVPVTLVN
jgi:hypothetical protein